MSGSLMMTFTATLAFAIQFLIFVYVYASYRLRFFHYLLWAWGFFTLSKGLKLAEVVLPEGIRLDPLMNATGLAAQFCVLAGALAYRWDYGVRRRDALVVALLALGVAALGDLAALGAGVDLAFAAILGGAQVAAGVVFWPRRSSGVGCRGVSLLAASFVGWGVHRVVSRWMMAEPGSAMYFGVHGAFIFFYFLSTFAIIIMVLDRARSEMRSLKEFNERVVDGLREGLELVGGDFTIRFANRWMLRQFGPLPGRRCYEVLTADGRPCPGCPMERRDTLEGPVRLEIAGVGGRRFLLSCSPVRQPDGETLLLELIADVTEQAQMRERLQRAERLAATGELAAGVAHEIRNPLAAIVNATTLLAARDGLSEEEHASTLDAVRTEARRLNRILSQFLLFARPPAPERRPADVAEVVGRVAALIGEDRARAGSIELDVRIDGSLPRFPFDPDQLTQVLWNVALNGVEAIEGRGRLRFDVERVDGDVVISVADTGRGIAPEDRARVFDPFYSRKPAGSGLGLTIAQRIVAAHGGRMELDSTPGQGTRVTIALPFAPASP
ncbi:MAG: two-component system sensor histidine kinase NtrB [Candidatus Rokuibacteriota bacterium]